MASIARPLVVATLCILAGLLVGLRYGAPVPAPLVVGAVVAGLAAAVWWPGAGLAALWMGFVAVGVAFGATERRALASDCRRHIPDGVEVRVRGVLAANPHPSDYLDGPAPLLPVQARTLTWRGAGEHTCAVAVRVRLPEEAAPLRAGAEVEAGGTWTRSRGPLARSGWPPNPRFAGFVVADRVAMVREPSFASHPLLFLRGATEAHLLRLFPLHGPLADALLLGRRERMDPALREQFARAGMAHLLAISGMHVGLLAAMMFVVVQGVRRVRAVSRGAAGVAILCGILLYLAVIGAPPSAVRAGVMICLAVSGLMLQRPFAALPVVAAAALVLLLPRPSTVLDPGFQLSFAGVLGILALRALVLEQIPEPWLERGWSRYLLESSVVSGAAFVATAPVVAWHFGLLAPVGLLSNLAAIPVMGVALAGVVLSAIAGAVLPPLGRVLALGTESAFHLLQWIADVSAALPLGHATVSRPGLWVWVAAGAGAVLVARVLLRRPPLQRWTLAAATAVVVFAAAPAVAGTAGVGAGRAEIHFIDVGQGDAVAIRTPRGRWVLVDAGPADARWDAGERRVLPFLRTRGVRRLEALVLTHPHADHIGGAVAVLNALPVGALIEPGYVTGSSHHLAVLRAAEARGVPWYAAEAGRTLHLDGMSFRFLWPDPEALDAATDANEVSVMLRVEWGAFAALLTGDAYAAQERIVVDRHGDGLRAALLKAGHHGSHTSTSAPLLDAVRPELVVVSAGRRNRFGHPAPEVLADLAARGIPVARTDLSGTVSVVVRGARAPAWSLVEP
jgi:competence protein ComEC